ncbi:hypothetical protein TNCV_2814921 [Trichonephila clavipes]|nr:hypothetical protein TNCV_2814921 [Trichonephila clavipes]
MIIRLGWALCVCADSYIRVLKTSRRRSDTCSVSSGSVLVSSLWDTLESGVSVQLSCSSFDLGIIVKAVMVRRLHVQIKSGAAVLMLRKLRQNDNSVFN